uniref:Uncharacterized protein n=1 Tax=Romanomermis culicivorax TaxID=13658 RepID=A0A915J0V9_ROMCU
MLPQEFDHLKDHSILDDHEVCEKDKLFLAGVAMGDLRIVFYSSENGRADFAPGLNSSFAGAFSWVHLSRRPLGVALDRFFSVLSCGSAGALRPVYTPRERVCAGASIFNQTECSRSARDGTSINVHLPVHAPALNARAKSINSQRYSMLWGYKVQFYFTKCCVKHENLLLKITPLGQRMEQYDKLGREHGRTIFKYDRVINNPEV